MGNLCNGRAASPKHTNNMHKISQTCSNRWTNRSHSNSTRTDTDTNNNSSSSSIGRRIQRQALSAATLYQQQQLDRYTSLRYQPQVNNNIKKKNFPRSVSSRTHSLADPLLHPHQLAPLQEINLDDLETKHVVLVHGGGFGAWCWYKTIALLEDEGFTVTAVDLTGSGIQSCDPNTITSISQYVMPLCDFLQKLSDEEKIAKAIYVAAVMLQTGQSVLRMFSEKAGSNELIQQAQIFLYSNGSDQPPTAIDHDKSLLRDLLFNQNPSKDVALASVSMRPTPFATVMESLSLSDAKYGSIRRFYIKTPENNAVSISLQEDMIKSAPPEQVFLLKGADHSPFFSKPQALHKLLLEISRVPAPGEVSSSVKEA